MDGIRHDVRPTDGLAGPEPIPFSPAGSRGVEHVVLAGLLACIGGQVAPLGGSREGLAFTCSGLQLAEGSHQFSLTVDLSDGSKKAGSVSWEVLSTRP